MEYLHAGPVAEADLIKPNPTLCRGHLNCLGAIRYLRFDVKQLEDALSGGHGSLELGVLHSQLNHGMEETLDIEHKTQQNPDAHLSSQHHIAAEDNDQAGADRVQYLGDGHHDRGQPGCLYIGTQICPVDIVKLLIVYLFPRQALDYPYPGDTLLEPGIDYGDSSSYPGEGTAGVSLPDEYHYAQHRYHGKSQQCQPPVHGKHDHGYAYQGQDIGQEVKDTAGEELLQLLHVVLHAGHQPTHLTAVKETHRQLLQVVKHIGA
ncbi:hypothetical protein ES703_53872 [subsurface metagenome]